MQGVHLRKYGVAATVDFELYEVDGVDFRTDWTPAAGDVFMMRDEAAEEQVTNASGNADLSTLVTDEGRGYSITLALEDMQTARVVVYLVDQATKAFLDKCLIIETYGNASAMHAFDLDTATQEVNVTQIDGQDTDGYNATLKLKQLNIQNSAGSALIAKSTGGGGYGMDVAGNLAGHGLVVEGGSTGKGIEVKGGASSGVGVTVTAVSGHAIDITAGNIGSAILAQGAGSGAGIMTVGGGTGRGIDARGGSTSGAGIRGQAFAGNDAGMELVKHGSGKDIDADEIAACNTVTPDAAGVVASAITTAHTATDGDLATIAGYLDNEIASIVAAVITNAAGTDIAADIIAIKTVLGALNTAASTGIPTDGDEIMAYVKQLVNDTRTTIFHGRGFSAYGVVSTATSATEFAASGLDVSHHTDDYFNGWWIYVLDADQGAPLHEWKQVSNYVSSGGVITHGAFTVQLEVNDQILLVNPVLYASILIKAETASIQVETTAIKVVTDNQAAASLTLITGQVSHDAVAASTTVIYSDDVTEATEDHYKGRLFVPTDGALLGQYTDITGYVLDGGEGKFTVTALTEAPADDSHFVII